jgi:uncharacterized membrane protein
MFRHRSIIVFALLFGYASRTLFLLRESLWRDEVDVIRFAFEPLTGGTMSQIGLAFNGPLYHLIMRGWLTLGGVNDFSLRYFSVVCGVLLLALIYVVTRRLAGRAAALLALAISACSAVLIWYAGEGKMYTLQPALATFGIYALLNATTAHNRNGFWWGAVAVVTALLAGVHILAPLLVGVFTAYVLVLGRDSLRRHIKGIVIVTLAMGLPALPLIVTQAGRIVQGGNIGHQFYPLNAIVQALAFNWTVGLNSSAPLFFLEPGQLAVDVLRWGAVTLFVMLGAAGLAALGNRASIVLLVGWLLIPMLAVFLISLRLPVFQPRYVLWSAPALYILIALGINALANQAVWLRAALTACVLLIGMAGWVGQLTRTIRHDLRATTAALVAAIQPADAVMYQIPKARESVRYYAPQLPAGAEYDGPYVNGGMDDAMLDQALAPIRDRHERIWLVQTERFEWDVEGATELWFDNNMKLETRLDFQGASLTLYSRK